MPLFRHQGGLAVAAALFHTRQCGDRTDKDMPGQAEYGWRPGRSCATLWQTIGGSAATGRFVRFQQGRGPVQRDDRCLRPAVHACLSAGTMPAGTAETMRGAV